MSKKVVSFSRKENGGIREGPTFFVNKALLRKKSGPGCTINNEDYKSQQ